MSVLIKNIKELVQVRESSPNKVSGTDMSFLPSIRNSFLHIEDGVVKDFGPMDDCPDFAQTVIEATGSYVLPSWCDSHTHLVYAGSRENEFVDRLKGLTYEEIARNGGGILNSAKRLSDASEEELLEGAQDRINEIIGMGTGAVEIKSGYGLTLESELKMLRVIKRLKATSPIPIKATFLGAHAVPSAYQHKRSEYIKLIIDKMLPTVADEKLADYCDVFCDRGFFTVEETDKILKAGIQLGLRPKIHANELDYSGGIQVGVENMALSVDHLEYTGDDEINALKNSDTMPTLLPGTAFFLSLPFPPARKMIDSGLPVALATDYNPGSTPSGNMPFIVSLACIKLKMLPEEAINAATINGAYAMDLSDQYGFIAKGNPANIFVTKPIPSLAYIPYMYGSRLIDKVVVAGKLIG